MGSDFVPLVNLGGRFKFMSNGTMMVESASSYDEGQYMCKADNGIGTPLSKVIYVSVNGKIDEQWIIMIIIKDNIKLNNF